MNRSYSKIRHIQEANQRLEQRTLNKLISEQMGENALQLAKDVINFIWDMNIIPGPVDGGKLLYDLYNSKNPIQTIKDFIYDRVPQPGENWKKIEQSLNRLGGDVSKFKSAIYQELKSKL